jgi:transposase-like protein
MPIIEIVAAALDRRFPGRCRNVDRHVADEEVAFAARLLVRGREAVVLEFPWPESAIQFRANHVLHDRADIPDDPPPLNWSTLKYVFGRRRRTTMLKKRHKPEEIVAKLRQVEVLTSQGKSVADAIRTIGVTEVTYYRWRQEFGGLKSDQVKRLKNLEAENARLRRAVSDLTLDKMILAEAARGNY